MPTAPDSVLAEPSAGSPPTSPPSVLAEASVATPTAPVVILAEPSAGSPPTAPAGVVDDPAPAVNGMTVSGITSPSGANGFYEQSGDLDTDGKPIYTKSGYVMGLGSYGAFPGTACWQIRSDSTPIASVYFNSAGRAATPDLETSWTAQSGSTGTPAVTPTDGVEPVYTPAAVLPEPS